MVDYNTPPQETQPTPEQILALASEFISHFNIRANPYSDRKGFLEELRKLDPLKSGDPRYVNEYNPTEYGPETEQIIRRAFDAMGMSQSETPLVPGHYKAILVLGAARQAPADRLDYLLQALQSGVITIDAIVVTGSVRPLGVDDDPTKSEVVNVSNYAPGAKLEGDLAEAVARGAKHDTTLPDDRVFSVVSNFVGTNPDNGRRFYADNDMVMTMAFQELGQLGLLSDDSRVGAVTTQIYQPGASFDLANVAARFGITDTLVAGNPSDPKIIANRSVSTLFTEVCRTFQKALTEQQTE